MNQRRRTIRLILSIFFFGISIYLAYASSESLAPLNPQPNPPPEQSQAASPEGSSDADTAIDQVAKMQPGLARVTKAVDGDTIEVSIGGKTEIIRFLGIDTPETHDPRKPVQCFGEKASEYTKALLDGKAVRLAPDPQNSNRDKYGRLLRYVYLPDGTLVNAQLIREGYAFAYTVFPLEKLDEFRALEADARQNNRGLWAGCNVNESSAIKQTSTPK